jgi:transposase
MVHLFWLSDDAWAMIEPHLPRGLPGKPRVDDRRVISGILHVLKVGCRWRDVPPEYGPATTIYIRYNRWSRRGLWQHLFEQVAASGEAPTELTIDSSHVKALIADKAYDLDSLRRWLKARRIRAVIPSTATRTLPYPLNRSAYRRRNLIERLFCRLNFRRIATRYDRLATNYMAALALVAVATEWT